MQCDERRPVCYNCERSRRYQCDGYEGYGSTSTNVPRFATPEWPGLSSITDTPFWNALQPLSQDDLGEEVAHQWDDFTNSAAFLGETQAPESPCTAIDATESSTVQLEFLQDFAKAAARLPALQTPLSLNLPFDGCKKMPSTVSRLLDHYRTHACQLMMPTLAPLHNPWLRLYLPLALQEPATAPKQVLLYAILSVAAFNRAHLSSTDKEVYQKQAKDFNEKAVSLLKHALDAALASEGLLDDKTTKQALMAAALTLTTAEVRNLAMLLAFALADRTTRSLVERVADMVIII